MDPNLLNYMLVLSTANHDKVIKNGSRSNWVRIGQKQQDLDPCPPLLSCFKSYNNGNHESSRHLDDKK